MVLIMGIVPIISYLFGYLVKYRHETSSYFPQFNIEKEGKTGGEGG